MIDRDAALKAVDEAAVEWIKQHFNDFCAGVAADGGSIDAALRRFDVGMGQMMRAYDAARALVAAKVSAAAMTDPPNEGGRV